MPFLQVKSLRNVRSNANNLVCSRLVGAPIADVFSFSNNGHRVFVDRDIVELAHIGSYP